MMASRSPAGWCTIAVLLCAAAAHAEPSAAQKEAARTLMAEAREQRDKQDLKGALSRFQAADAIMNVPTTGFEVAKTQADLGQWVEALTTVKRILTIPAKPDDPEPFRVARSKAADLGDSLRARVSSLHLIVTGLPSGVKAAIFVDRVPVAAEGASVPFPVNPGHHRVVAKASGQEITGEVDADPDAIEAARGTFSVDMTAFDAGDWLKNRKLRKDFELESYPTATFSLDAVSLLKRGVAGEAGPGMIDNAFEAKARGTLQWRGKQLAIELGGKGTLDANQLAADATFELDITRLGLQAPRFFMFKVEDVVTVAVRLTGVLA